MLLGWLATRVLPNIDWSATGQSVLIVIWCAGVFATLLGALSLWAAAIKRDGVAKGGTLGLVPAIVFLLTGTAIWPIYAIVAFMNRRKLAVFYQNLFQ
jgi:hypothetical protein